MTRPGQGVRLLVVEDNDVNRDMLQRRLTRKGFTVFTAANGQQALDLVRLHLPDVVLMDLSLPDIDGWEATRRIKADPATAGVAVIALTAHAMAGDRARALAAGCDDFATKPFEMTALLAQIAAAVAHSDS